jgi:CubicO group peptidase (beta-lactamase class C family)
MRSILLSLLFVVAAATPGFAQKAGAHADQLAKIRPRMQQFADSGLIPGTVTLVAHRGEIVHYEAAGWHDIEKKRPMTKDSIFQIMSMTKPVTGVAVMMMVEDGKLLLNDPVEKYLPEFKGQNPARPILVRELMSHTSGMQANPLPYTPAANLYTKLDMTLEEAVKVFAKAPMAYDPGTKWLYSNMGIATLGRLVEVTSGMPYEQFVQTRIFDPLGMKDSFFFLPASHHPRLATLYRTIHGKLERWGDGSALGGDALMYRPGAKYSAPEFGMYSTATDLLAFYEMTRLGGTYRGKRLLSPASLAAMTALHTAGLKAGHNPGTGFGLTWEVTAENLGMLTLMSHGSWGHGGAFGTHGWIDPKKEMVGVFLIQGGSFNGSAKAAFMAMSGAAMPE